MHMFIHIKMYGKKQKLPSKPFPEHRTQTRTKTGAAQAEQHKVEGLAQNDHKYADGTLKIFC